MNNGPGRRLLISLRRKASLGRSPYLALGFISLYGVLVSTLEFREGGLILNIKPTFGQDGTEGTDRVLESDRQRIPFTLKQPGWGIPPPRQLICLVPTTGAARRLPGPWASVPDSLFPPLILDTIICWEAYER